MWEVLIGSPSVAFAFGIQTLHRSGPSQAARPLAELGRSLLQWHRCCSHSGQPFGCGEVLVRGPAPPSGASRLRVARDPLLAHGGATAKGRAPFIPWLKPRALLAHFL